MSHSNELGYQTAVVNKTIWITLRSKVQAKRSIYTLPRPNPVDEPPKYM